jgi:hypothetical protein
MSVKWRRRKRDRRICVLEMASQTLAIDRMAAAEAKQSYHDILARAVDAVVHRPGQQPGAGHRGGRFGKTSLGIEAGHEGFRTEHAGDEAGRDLGHVTRPRGGQRERAKGRAHAEDQDHPSSGHGFLRQGAWGRGPATDRNALNAARQIRKRAGQ